MGAGPAGEREGGGAAGEVGGGQERGGGRCPRGRERRDEGEGEERGRGGPRAELAVACLRRKPACCFVRLPEESEPRFRRSFLSGSAARGAASRVLPGLAPDTPTRPIGSRHPGGGPLASV